MNCDVMEKDKSRLGHPNFLLLTGKAPEESDVDDNNQVYSRIKNTFRLLRRFKSFIFTQLSSTVHAAQYPFV